MTLHFIIIMTRHLVYSLFLLWLITQNPFAKDNTNLLLITPPVPISDPIEDFLIGSGFTPKAQLLKMEVDINRDGRNEIFLAIDEDFDQDLGHLWKMYLFKKIPYQDFKGQKYPGIYKRLSESSAGLIRFHPELCRVGYIPSIQKMGLLIYWGNAPEVGSLWVHALQKDTLREYNLGQIEPHGKDKALFQELFLNKPAPKLEKIPIIKLIDKYHLKFELISKK